MLLDKIDEALAAYDVATTAIFAGRPDWTTFVEGAASKWGAFQRQLSRGPKGLAAAGARADGRGAAAGAAAISGDPAERRHSRLCAPACLARIHRSSRCRGQLMAETRLRATERDRLDAWVPA